MFLPMFRFVWGTHNGSVILVQIRNVAEKKKICENIVQVLLKCAFVSCSFEVEAQAQRAGVRTSGPPSMCFRM